MPAVAIGSLLGGYLVKKLSLNAEGATKLALGCSIIALVGQISLMFIGCDSAGIAGVDTPYHDSRFITYCFLLNLRANNKTKMKINSLECETFGDARWQQVYLKSIGLCACSEPRITL